MSREAWQTTVKVVIDKDRCPTNSDVADYLSSVLSISEKDTVIDWMYDDVVMPVTIPDADKYEEGDAFPDY